MRNVGKSSQCQELLAQLPLPTYPAVSWLLDVSRWMRVDLDVSADSWMRVRCSIFMLDSVFPQLTLPHAISVAYGPYLTEVTHPTPSPVKLHWMQHSCEGVHAVYEMVPGGPYHSRKGQAVCAWLQHSLPLLAARNPTQEQPPAAERSGEDRSTIAYGKERSSARSKKRV